MNTTCFHTNAHSLCYLSGPASFMERVIEMFMMFWLFLSLIFFVAIAPVTNLFHAEKILQWDILGTHHFCTKINNA
ncbi:MAG TPA: hypothetical protein VIP70_01280 [Nitrososphaeraceae archaeon]|jgi:preprotein translocase subunit SecG